MSFIGPSHREQTATLTHRRTFRAPAKTRFNNAAQSRRYAECGGGGFGDGDGVANDDCGGGAGSGPVEERSFECASAGGEGTTLQVPGAPHDVLPAPVPCVAHTRCGVTELTQPTAPPRVDVAVGGEGRRCPRRPAPFGLARSLMCAPA
jgi:hypothetical protein